MSIHELLEQGPGAVLAGPGFLKSSEIKTSRGKGRLTGILADAKSEVPFVCWEPWQAKGIVAGDVVIAEGSLGVFNDAPQLTLDRMRLARPSDEVDVEALVPTASVPPAESWQRIETAMGDLQSPLAVAAWEIFRDTYGERFRVHPAAKSIHHAYRGGLAMHVATMLEHAQRVMQTYRDMRFHRHEEPLEAFDVDTVLLGILFHDAGKLAELPCLPGDYTAAELAGHIVVGARIWHDVLDAAMGPPVAGLRLGVEHVILSHHGDRDKGAVVEPATPEAIIVAMIDRLDASLVGLWDALGSSDGPVRRAFSGNVYRRAPAVDPLDLAQQLPTGAQIRGEDPPAPKPPEPEPCPGCGHVTGKEDAECRCEHFPCPCDSIPF